MKQQPRMSTLKKGENQKLTTKDQKAIVECAHQLRKIGDVFNFKYKLLDMLAKKENKGCTIK
ncbi:phorbol-12-myristate-13-acetate-induced protein 1 [Anguilla rostrata]|uniref:phorbol-12-myristate-13-acetate-induced protein 1 n=1 Tax=Anguilla anguilla TaxID=7936 RepID=UPI0015B26C6B|nr:phorbol-12-myristate-13-acetate-induced protein 1 [Anguilla anguilla]